MDEPDEFLIYDREAEAAWVQGLSVDLEGMR
jgi:hypothetical protein